VAAAPAASFFSPGGYAVAEGAAAFLFAEVVVVHVVVGGVVVGEIAVVGMRLPASV